MVAGRSLSLNLHRLPLVLGSSRAAPWPRVGARRRSLQKNRGSGDQGARRTFWLFHRFGHGHEVEEPEPTEFQNFHEGRGGLVTVPGSRLQRCLELSSFSTKNAEHLAVLPSAAWNVEDPRPDPATPLRIPLSLL